MTNPYETPATGEAPRRPLTLIFSLLAVVFALLFVGGVLAYFLISAPPAAPPAMTPTQTSPAAPQSQ